MASDLEITHKAIGPHVRAWQRLHGYSISDMASMFGFTTGYCQKIIATVPSGGKSNTPTLGDICRMAEVMGLKPHELLMPPGASVEVGPQFRLHDLIERVDELSLMLQAAQRSMEGHL